MKQNKQNFGPLYGPQNLPELWRGFTGAKKALWEGNEMQIA